MDRQTFEARVEALWPALVRTARCVVREPSDAEDAAAQAVCNCYAALARLKDESRFEAWLTRACINEARMILRRRSRFELRETLPDLPAHAPDDAQSLQEWLALLPQKDRLALTLMYYNDLSLSQTAQALGVPRGTAASRISRARKKLKTILEQEGFFP